ncbi:MAG: hypothetical protein WCF57_05220 [Pyrinomonadaceae bacterium]
MLRLITSKSLLALCACILLLVSGSFIKQSARAIQPTSTAQGDCPPIFFDEEEFDFGTGQGFFSLRLSSDGNIRWIRSPNQITHIDDQEGYVVCGTGVATAYDAGFIDSGWSQSTVMQCGGPGTLPMIFTRQTLDGTLELQQIIDWNPQEKEVFITMTLKNISGAQLTNVRLARYFNGDISRVNNSPFTDAIDDIYDRDTDAVWGKDNGAGANHHNISLLAQTAGLSHTAAVESKANYDTTKTTCEPIPEAVPTAPGDYTGRLTYNLGTFNVGVSRTVKYIYRRM